MTDDEWKIREQALRDAAAIARVWTESYAKLEISSNPQLAKAFATVTRHTAEAIEQTILELIDKRAEQTADAQNDGGRPCC